MPPQVYRVPSLLLPKRLTFSKAEMQLQREARRRLLLPLPDLDGNLLSAIAWGSRPARRCRALDQLKHALSDHALAWRTDEDQIWKAAEAERKFKLEKAAFKLFCAPLWRSAHESDAQAFVDLLQRIGARLDEKAQIFRTRPISTTADSRGRRRCFPPAAEIEVGLLQLWRFENNNLHLNPVVRATIFHYGIRVLHPFSDGNGRLARILFNVFACEGDPGIAYIPCRQLFNASQYGYEIRLHQMDSEQNWNPLISFFCQVVLAYDQMRKKALRYRVKPSL